MGEDLGRLRSSLSIYLVSGILNTAIPFLPIPVLTRFLSPADMALWVFS